MSDPQLTAAMAQMANSVSQMTTNVNSIQRQLSTVLQQLSKEAGAASGNIRRWSSSMENFSGAADDYSSHLNDQIKDITSGTREYNDARDRELERYNNQINRTSSYFSQDNLLKERQLQSRASELKQLEMQLKSRQNALKGELNTTKQQREAAQTKLRQAYEYDKQGNAIRQLVTDEELEARREAVVATSRQFEEANKKFSATTKALAKIPAEAARIEQDLAKVKPAAAVEDVKKSIEDGFKGFFKGLLATASGLLAKGISDTISTARAEIKTQGSLGGFADKNAVSQMDTAKIGVSRPEFVQLAAEYRRTMLAMGGLNASVQNLKMAQEELYKVSGDQKEVNEAALLSYDTLAKSGINPTASRLKSFTQNLAADYKDFGARTGLSLKQYADTLRTLNEDEATQQALRMAANEQEREQILKNNQARLKENIAMGMTVEQATNAAKTLNKLAGESPIERYKKSMKLQMAMGAMGIAGGADAARIYRKPENKRTAEEKAQLQGAMSAFENKTAGMMGSEDLGTAFLGEKIRGASGQSESDLAAFNTNAVKPMTDGLNKNTDELKKLNENMSGWVKTFAAFDTLKSIITNAPWVSMVVGGMAALAGTILAANRGFGIIGKVIGGLSSTLSKTLGGAAGKIGGLFGRGGAGAAGGLAGAANTAGAANAGTGGKGPGLMGRLADGLEKISKPKLLIGVAVLTGLAGSLFATGKALQQFASVEWSAVAKGMVSIAGIAGISMLLGKASPMMILGSVGIGILSLSLIAAGKGMQSFANVDWETVGKGMATMAGLGVIGAVAGLAAPLILAGGAALGVMSGAMWIASEAAVKFSSAFQGFANIKWGEFGAQLGMFGTGLSQLWDNAPNPVKIGVLAGSIGALGLALKPVAESIALIGTDKLSEFVNKVTQLASIDPAKINNVATALKSVKEAADNSPSLGATTRRAFAGVVDKFVGQKPAEKKEGGEEQTSSGSRELNTLVSQINMQMMKMDKSNEYLRTLAENMPQLVQLANKQLEATMMTDAQKQEKGNKPASAPGGIFGASFNNLFT